MKKIINGKIYDTDKATEIGCNGNGGSWRDFSHWEETLYRKRTGEYFLFGEGGPMTKYAEAQGQNSWSGGSRIMPMIYDEARSWAEKNLDAEVYESEFGEIVEDDSTEIITISIPVSVAAKIRREAQQNGVSVSGIISSKF